MGDKKSIWCIYYAAVDDPDWDYQERNMELYFETKEDALGYLNDHCVPQDDYLYQWDDETSSLQRYEKVYDENAFDENQIEVFNGEAYSSAGEPYWVVFENYFYKEGGEK